MTYILLKIFLTCWEFYIYIYIYIYIDGPFDHLRHQKYKNKQLENNFKPINISINDIDKFEKKRTKKKTFTKNTSYDWYN